MEAGDDPGQVIDVPPGEILMPPACALAVFGVRLVAVGRLFARSEVVVSDVHLNQAGKVQGGVYSVIADATAGWAAEAFLGHPDYVTTSYTAQLVGAAGEGDRIRTEATVLHPGRRTVVVTADLWRDSESGSPRRIAQFTCQQLVLG
ncbi:MAG: PaaI family thioesterase [Nocardioidaceae bacterium]|nr:MAG: PaaI family thioesterase [Nocardioidaceae bacterium]